LIDHACKCLEWAILHEKGVIASDAFLDAFII